jgi:hypothetical protein
MSCKRENIFIAIDTRSVSNISVSDLAHVAYEGAKYTFLAGTDAHLPYRPSCFSQVHYLEMLIRHLQLISQWKQLYDLGRIPSMDNPGA